MPLLTLGDPHVEFSDESEGEPVRLPVTHLEIVNPLIRDFLDAGSL
ncbi:MAG: hypothetical protein HZB55_06885 [Deltaproteobacteria bacterium]|nr:hypothetical protein [Deltaproteobacteria bacterium]